MEGVGGEVEYINLYHSVECFVPRLSTDICSLSLFTQLVPQWLA